MLAAILGHPFSGYDDVACGIAQRVAGFAIVGFGELQRFIQRSEASAAAATARDLISAGQSVPDAIVGQLIVEATTTDSSDVLLVGYPRNLVQWQALRSVHGVPWIIHVHASESLLDAKRHALGQPALEQAHPGALGRMDAEVAPLLDATRVTGQLLSLDAGAAQGDLVESALRFLSPHFRGT